jgi:phospholipid/cholesterol/gamma-HCH transport system substrate-binding protein
MGLTRQIRIQFAVFLVIALLSGAVLFFQYMRAPSHFVGVGRYAVTLQLSQDGGLYEDANVTYRGYQVGRVKAFAADRYRRRRRALVGRRCQDPR